MPVPDDEPAWAMLEALDVWGKPFMEALDDPQAYDRWLNSTPRDIALTLAASSVTGDIRNGGFEQCMWNSFGTSAPEALIVLQQLGLDRFAVLLAEAIGRFGPNFPRHREARQALLDKGEVVLADLDSDDLIPMLEAYDGLEERRLNDFAAATLAAHRK